MGVGYLEGYDQESPRLPMAANLIPVLAALALALACVGVSPVQVPVPTPNPVPAPRLPPTSPGALDIFTVASGVGTLSDRSVSPLICGKSHWHRKQELEQQNVSLHPHTGPLTLFGETSQCSGSVGCHLDITGYVSHDGSMSTILTLDEDVVDFLKM